MSYSRRGSSVEFRVNIFTTMVSSLQKDKENHAQSLAEDQTTP